MAEIEEFLCPFYNRIVDEDECCDMFMIASRMFIDETLVKEDRDNLYNTCLKCNKHGFPTLK